MNSILKTILTAGALYASVASAATIEIAGDLTMQADLKGSPVSALAIGPLAKAKAAVNEISGSVKTGGKVEMKATLTGSPVSALAIGPGAEATARVNAVASH